MKALPWAERIYSRAQAADLAAIHEGTLDVLIHRMKDVAFLFSEKRGSSRVFSARDIAVLKVAHDLERAGQTWLTALARAHDNLQNIPPPSALLVTPALSVSSKSSRFASGPQAITDETLVIVPIGAIVADIIAKIGGRP
jgi:hypothetical protein